MPYSIPIKAEKHFSKEEIEDLYEYIIHNVKAKNDKLRTFRDQKLPEYVKIYKGTPKNKEVDFPWPGAANLVIQLVGTFCDELLSRVMGSLYMYDPLFSISLSGDSDEANTDGVAEKRILEKFLMDEAYDPEALDFYRVEQAFYNSCIKYGTGFMEFPWEYNVEKNLVVMPGLVPDKEPEKGDFRFNEVIKRDSPHPKIVPLNKVGVDPRIPVLADQRLFYTIETLGAREIKDLAGRNDLYKGIDDKLKAVTNSPDREHPMEMQQIIQEELQLDNISSSPERTGAEWDLYTCYITYQKGNETYSLIAKVHIKSETVLWVIFNNNPKNLFPVEDVKLSYDDENYFGTGYAQMLRSYQKELSQNSNWRTNNRNFAMMGLYRIDPGSKLSSILQMYPGVMVPAKDGEIERIQAGADVGYASEPDNFIMGCAKERAGVDPAISGSGGGMVNPKRGIYSASGTSMMLIQQNNRNNLRMSDMRSAHVRIAIKLMQLYSSIGIGERIKKYASQAELLKKSFSDFQSGNLGFRLRPTTASNNKELERQNDILLAGALERFYQQNAQIIQALSNPSIQQQMPKLFEYYQQVLVAGTALYKDILGNFNKENTARLLPAPPSFNQPAGGAGGASINAGPNAQISGPQASGIQGPIPTGGFQTASQIPQ